MLITKLTLKNFGIYAGVNVFEFSGHKPVVLIGGMNGRGKTTFLEAVLLALYGSNSFAYSESKYTSYGQYLKAYVNVADGSLETSVELEFRLDESAPEKYRIERKWSGSQLRTREVISVFKDEEYSRFLTENWALFVENILPSGLSNFFFFDGEKIAELAVDNTNQQMKQSIKALLGITVLDVLSNDIARVISRASRNSDNQIELKEIELLREKKDAAENALHLIDEHIESLNRQIQDAKKKLDKCRTEYTAKGGDIVSQRQDLFAEKNRLTLQIEQMKFDLVECAAGELPLLMVKPLLENIFTQAEKEREAHLFEVAIGKMNDLLPAYSKTTLKGTASIQDFIRYVEETAKEESTDQIYNLPDHSLYQLDNLLRTQFIRAKGSALRSMGEICKAQGKSDEIDSYLSVDIDEKSLTRLYKKIKTLEQDIIDWEVELAAEQKKRISAHGETIRISGEYGKRVESMLMALEMSDDSARLIKYAHNANKVLGEYKIRLQARKMGLLADTMTDCYKKLANKKNLIDLIRIDPVTLDLSYLSSDGTEIPNASLSAGEKQLMVISLLWALAICSKKKLPVIIDTPLSRLDSDHRLSLITTYFPQASEQTIILSTDSEVDEQYYGVMKKDIGDEYTIIYDDESKSSSVERGYFRGRFNAN